MFLHASCDYAGMDFPCWTWVGWFLPTTVKILELNFMPDALSDTPVSANLHYLEATGHSYNLPSGGLVYY